MKFYWSILLVSLCIAYSLQTVEAVPPPDFIFQIGSQIAQVFSILLLLFAGVFGTCKHYLRNFFVRLKHPRIVMALIAVVLVGLALGGATLYENQRQTVAYQEWVKQSKEHKDENKNSTPLDMQNTATGAIIKENELVSELPVSPEEKFIRDYYENIGLKQYERAYAVSKKSVSLLQFIAMYDVVDKIVIHHIQNIDNKLYSITLTLFEGKRILEYKLLWVLKQIRIHIELPLQ